jgi:hypothetical protein
MRKFSAKNIPLRIVSPVLRRDKSCMVKYNKYESNRHRLGFVAMRPISRRRFVTQRGIV